MKQNKARVLHPLDANRDEVLSDVYENDPITDPRSAFKLNIGQKSNEAVRLQFGIHEKAIIAAVKRKEPELAAYKLEELQKLKDIFKHDPNYAKQYEEILKQIGAIVKDNFETNVKLLSRCLTFGNSLNMDDISSFNAAFLFA